VMMNIVRIIRINSHIYLSLSFCIPAFLSRLLSMICHCDCEVQVLTVVSIQSVVLWVVTPCNSVEGYKCMEEPAVFIFRLKE